MTFSPTTDPAKDGRTSPRKRFARGQDHLAPQVLQALLVLQALPALLAHKALPVLQALPALLVHKALPALLALSALRDLLAPSSFPRDATKISIFRRESSTLPNTTTMTPELPQCL